MPAKKRRRATVVAERDGRFLLVKEQGARRYTLPGGGIEGRESVIEAACRELREETRLSVKRAKHLFDYEGQAMSHRVVLATVSGTVRLQRRELADHLWWDGKSKVELGASAQVIMETVFAKHFRTSGWLTMVRFLKRLFSGNPRAPRRDRRSWQRIGDNRDTRNVPQWVISAFSEMPGSHGTRLIDYPEPGMSIRFKGRTYRYRIDMGNQSWQVYRRIRRRAMKHSGA